MQEEKNRQRWKKRERGGLSPVDKGLGAGGGKGEANNSSPLSGKRRKGLRCTTRRLRVYQSARIKRCKGGDSGYEAAFSCIIREKKKKTDSGLPFNWGKQLPPAGGAGSKDWMRTKIVSLHPPYTLKKKKIFPRKEGKGGEGKQLLRGQKREDCLQSLGGGEGDISIRHQGRWKKKSFKED